MLPVTVRRLQTVGVFRCNGDGARTPRADFPLADLLNGHGIAEGSVYGWMRTKVLMDLYVRGAIPVLILKKPHSRSLSDGTRRLWGNVGHAAAACFDSDFYSSCVQEPESVRGLQQALGDGAHKFKEFACTIEHNHGSSGLTDLIDIIKTMEGALKGTDVVSKHSFVTPLLNKHIL